MSTIRIFAVGDICGGAGLDALRRLTAYKKFSGVSFCVVNGENANGLGVTPAQCDEMLARGADVVTLGNHAYNNQLLIPYLDDSASVLRPSNFAPGAPGRGWGVFETEFGNICVISLIGRVAMDPNENPFHEINRVLRLPEVTACVIKLVDFHAEATSEKIAMAYHLDGRVSALWGTHTHVQTNDARVMPRGSGYITDLGMTGAIEGVIGMKVETSVARFLGNPKHRHEPAEGPARVEGAIFDIDLDTGLCAEVETVRIL